MPSLALPDRLIWFAHCPKAGGTSVEAAMVETWGPGVGHLAWGWARRRRRSADAGRTSPQHMIWAEARTVLRRAPDHSFALVRDPVTRMESEYRWQRSRAEATLVGRMLARLPFPLWLRLMLALARHDPCVFDNHFRAQSDFVPEEARVFRLEDGTGPVAEWLSALAGQTVTLPHRLKGRSVEGLATAACRARIARVFIADYDRFGYAPAALPCDASAPDDRLFDIAAPLLAWLDRRALL